MHPFVQSVILQTIENSNAFSDQPVRARIPRIDWRRKATEFRKLQELVFRSGRKPLKSRPPLSGTGIFIRLDTIPAQKMQGIGASHPNVAVSFVVPKQACELNGND